jgi:branched-chain amino acid transport system permease protein
MDKTTRSNLITYGMVIVAFAVMQGLSSIGAIGSSTKGLLIPICAYISLGISLNLVVGISGELSLGHAGFMSVGAFTGVVVSSLLSGVVANGALRFLLASLAAGGAAALETVAAAVSVLTALAGRIGPGRGGFMRWG